MYFITPSSADEAFDQAFGCHVIVTNSGNLQHLPPGMFKSTCEVSIEWFPFDSQVGCSKIPSNKFDYETNK
ncbi:unnamed protein product [Protopolystoma xenopodis]|uniref:Neurotransmitter-gated ion-channel ligand-binding domain-containing protein n=1 Tax=Protopolystoma xenopodis TaxID=117903 RepID=A0A448X3E9_9PLAT|nr:unnamed protein product [Protopolystoma xenopodis]